MREDRAEIMKMDITNSVQEFLNVILSGQIEGERGGGKISQLKTVLTAVKYTKLIKKITQPATFCDTHILLKMVESTNGWVENLTLCMQFHQPPNRSSPSNQSQRV